MFFIVKVNQGERPFFFRDPDGNAIEVIEN